MTPPSSGALVVRVAIDNATSTFDREYHYTVPERLAARACLGARAIVPFGARDAPRDALILGIVGGQEGGQPAVRLKEVADIPDSSPLLRQADIELAAYMRGRYFCTWFDALRCMLPKGWERGPDSSSPDTVRGVRLAAPGGAGDGGITPFPEVGAPQGRGLEGKSPEGCAPQGRGLEGGTPKLQNEQQRRAYRVLDERGEMTLREAALAAEVGVGVFETLARNGVAEFTAIAADKIPGEIWARSGAEPFEPTPEQALAIGQARRLLDGGRYAEMLLHGVTGSGKTEVYLQAISHALSQGRQSIVLVPEISLTPQMVSRFRGRFGERVAVFHSRLSLGERKDQWLRVRSGAAPIALGARSAVFAPHAEVGLAVIDEEHESSYKSEMTPRYHAADIARRRCERSGGLLLLGSATPSVERYWNARAYAAAQPGAVGAERTQLGADGARIAQLGAGGAGIAQLGADGVEIALPGAGGAGIAQPGAPLAAYASMARRATPQALPEVQVVDMREELKAGNRGMFSSALAQALTQAMAEGKQAMLLLNRRGYATFVLCRGCGYIATCRDCSVSYSYHSDAGRLLCHYCGMSAPMPAACPMCGSGAIRQFGAGTERVEAEVARLLPSCSVLRMDRDTTSGKDSHAKILGAFRDKKADVLVGTQMIAKGHDFPNVTLVGALAADALLNFNEYRAPERAFQLLTQVAGRAGRGDSRGRVVIQTYNPDHYCIVAAKAHDYGAFFRQEIAARRDLGYPPFRHIGVAVVSGNDDARCGEAAKSLHACVIRDRRPGLAALAPTRPPIAKVRGKHRWRMVLKHDDELLLHAALRSVVERFSEEKMHAYADLGVDIDPFSMS